MSSFTPSTIAHLKRVSVGRWLHGTPKNTLVRVFLPLRAFTNTRNLSPTRALLKKQAAETLAKPLLFPPSDSTTYRLSAISQRLSTPLFVPVNSSIVRLEL
jgi:hypothetical protein